MKLSAKICLALGGVVFLVGVYLFIVAIRGDYIWTIEPPILGVGLILLGSAVVIHLRDKHARKHPQISAETPVPAAESVSENTKPAPTADSQLDPRWGFPLAAAILFSIYTIIEIFFVKGNGLDGDWVFDNSITAAFLGGAGSSMMLAVLATALLWAGIAANRRGLYTSGMILVCICAGLWLIHIWLSALPLVLGWVGAAKWKKGMQAANQKAAAASAEKEKQDAVSVAKITTPDVTSISTSYEKWKAERERIRKDTEEKRQKRIEAEEAEIDELLDGPYKVNVYRLTHCVSPSIQDNIFALHEPEKLGFSGDDDNDEVVWVVDLAGDKIGRLPKDAAARYLEEGAVAIFVKSLEYEGENLIPFVRVFWKEKA